MRSGGRPWLIDRRTFRDIEVSVPIVVLVVLGLGVIPHNGHLQLRAGRVRPAWRLCHLHRAQRGPCRVWLGMVAAPFVVGALGLCSNV